MGAQQTAAKRARVRPEVKVVPIETLTGRGSEIHEMVARRAYQIFLGRGCEAGQDHDDWKQAETELTCRIPVGVMEAGDSLIVHAGLAGCGVEQVNVAVEPLRLVIAGHSERIGQNPVPAPVFQIIPLPIKVATTGMEMTLANGMLELKLPRA